MAKKHKKRYGAGPAGTMQGGPQYGGAAWQGGGWGGEAAGGYGGEAAGAAYGAGNGFGFGQGQGYGAGFGAGPGMQAGIQAGLAAAGMDAGLLQGMPAFLRTRNTEQFLIGALIGAAAAWVLSDEELRGKIVKSAMKLYTGIAGGFEEMKEQMADIRAEVDAERHGDA